MFVSDLHVLLEGGPLRVCEDGLDGNSLPHRHLRLQVDKQCHVLEEDVSKVHEQLQEVLGCNVLLLLGVQVALQNCKQRAVSNFIPILGTQK